jgi:hypothetical protein
MDRIDLADKKFIEQTSFFPAGLQKVVHIAEAEAFIDCQINLFTPKDYWFLYRWSKDVNPYFVYTQFTSEQPNRYFGIDLKPTLERDFQIRQALWRNQKNDQLLKSIWFRITSIECLDKIGLSYYAQNLNNWPFLDWEKFRRDQHKKPSFNKIV